MKALKMTAVCWLVYALAVTGPVVAADESKLDDAKRQVESGAATAGEGIKETARGVGNTVVEGAKAADRAVHEHPYEAIGIAFAVGALVGYLLARRSHNSD